MNQVQWMETAFALAEESAAEGEIPVGAVIVDREGLIIGRGRNRRESGDPLGQNLRLKAISCRVVGVMEEQGVSSFGTDQDDFVRRGAPISHQSGSSPCSRR